MASADVADGATEGSQAAHGPGVRGPSWALMSSLAFLLVSIVLVFARSLFFERTLHVGDIATALYPWQAYLAHSRLAGDWFPWCDRIGCGFPFWANGQSGALNPVNLLFLLPLRSWWLFGLGTMLQYVVAAFGMLLLARRFRLGWLPSVTCAILFALTGFMTAHQVHYSFIAAAAWLPWSAYGMTLWVSSRRPAGLFMASIGFAMIALNHPQAAVLAAPFIIGSAAIHLVQDGSRQALRGRVLVSLGLAVLPLVCGLLVAAVALVPTVSLLRAGCGSGRGGYEYMTSYSLPPRYLVTLLLPDFCGTAWGGNYEGPGNHWEVCGYFGGVALCLSLLGMPRGRQLRVACHGFALLALAALLLAFGGHTPLYGLLCHVPVLSSLRCPARWLLVFSASTSLIVGLALQGLPVRLADATFSRRSGWLFLGLCIVSGIAVAGIFFAPNTIVRVTGSVLPEGWAAEMLCGTLRRPVAANLLELALAAGLAGSGFWLFAAKAISARRVVGVLVIVIVLQAMFFAWRYNPVTSPAFWGTSPLVERIRAEQGQVGRVLQYECESSDWPVELGLRPNANLLYGISLLDIYEPLKPPAAALIDRIGQERLLDPETAAALGVKTLIMPASAPTPGPGWKLTTRVADCSVYRNAAYHGIAWTVASSTPEAAFEASLSSPTAPLGFMIRRPLVDPPPDRGASQGFTARKVRTTKLTGGHFSFEVGNGSACTLVVAIANLPGWEAQLDGRAVRIGKANKAFMALPLPSGPCTVDLRYSPAGLRQGALLALVGLVILVVVVIAGHRRSRCRATASAAPGAETHSGLR